MKKLVLLLSLFGLQAHASDLIRRLQCHGNLHGQLL